VVDLTIKAGPDLNRSSAGTPLAVAVRLYSLNARGRFSSADAYATTAGVARLDVAGLGHDTLTATGNANTLFSYSGACGLREFACWRVPDGDRGWRQRCFVTRDHHGVL
jgi:hypothetical protein